MKKFFIVLFLVCLLSLLLPFMTGMSYNELYTYLKDTYYEYTQDEYFECIELEAYNEKNSYDIGTVSAKLALDKVKEEYATSFSKMYFNEEKESYLYKSNAKGQNMFLASTDIVCASLKDFYEVTLFRLKDIKDNDYDDREIIDKYYVDSMTLDIYKEDELPEKTFEFSDNGLGLKLFFSEDYKDTIKVTYLDKITSEVDGNEVMVTPLEFNYLNDEALNKLFLVLAFKCDMNKEDFTLDTSNGYYLGKNDNYSFVLIKSDIEEDYAPNAKDYLENDFTYTINNAKVY